MRLQVISDPFHFSNANVFVGIIRLRVSRAPSQLPPAVNPVALYILAICFAGALVAGVAFAWAALRGEFADAAQTAFLVFDEDDAAAQPPAPSTGVDLRPPERTR